MKSAENLTLNAVKKSPKVAGVGSTTRLTDFMTSEQKIALQKANYTARRPQKRRYDAVDALAAEILARFGWEPYRAWQRGDIDNDRMVKYLLAERARERSRLLNAEAMILAMISSLVKREKGQPKPRGVTLAQKIYKEEAEMARGVK